MAKLPKVPDILKIPEKTELSYTQQEFKALQVGGFLWRASMVGGFGGADFVEEMGVKMLETPLDEETRAYRQEFFTELMTDEWLRSELKRISKDLPTESPITMEGRLRDRDAAALATERILKLPETLESLAELEGFSPAMQEINSFAREFLEAIPEFTALAHEINEELKPRRRVKRGNSSYYSVDMDELIEIVRKIEPHLRFLNMTNDLKDRLNTYHIFSYLCSNGCESRFLDKELKEGHIEQGYHLAYCTGAPGGNDWEKAVTNNADWSLEDCVSLISGANSGGKSVYLRMIGLNTLLAMNGFWPLADKMHLSPIRRIWPCFDFGDAIGTGHLETGLAYVANMKDNATRDDLILMDEPAQGTEPAEEVYLARGYIADMLLPRKLPSFVVTHDLDIVHDLSEEPLVKCLRVADYDDEKRRYSVSEGIAEGGYARRLAQKYGVDPETLEKDSKKRTSKKRSSKKRTSNKGKN